MVDGRDVIKAAESVRQKVTSLDYLKAKLELWPVEGPKRQLDISVLISAYGIRLLELKSPGAGWSLGLAAVFA